MQPPTKNICRATPESVDWNPRQHANHTSCVISKFPLKLLHSYGNYWIRCWTDGQVFQSVTENMPFIRLSLHKRYSVWKSHCLFNSFVRLTTKKTSQVHMTVPLWGGSTGDALGNGPLMPKVCPCHDIIIICMWTSSRLLNDAIGRLYGTVNYISLDLDIGQSHARRNSLCEPILT